jgi:hypothetical protein
MFNKPSTITTRPAKKFPALDGTRFITVKAWNWTLFSARRILSTEQCGVTFLNDPNYTVPVHILTHYFLWDDV